MDVIRKWKKRTATVRPETSGGDPRSHKARFLLGLAKSSMLATKDYKKKPKEITYNHEFSCETWLESARYIDTVSKIRANPFIVAKNMLKEINEKQAMIERLKEQIEEVEEKHQQEMKEMECRLREKDEAIEDLKLRQQRRTRKKTGSIYTL